MATDTEFGEYSVAIKPRPVKGATLGTIPETLATFLDENWEAAMKDPDNEIVLNTPTEQKAKLLLDYAKAWGSRRTPQVRVTKAQKTMNEPPTMVRLQFALAEEVTQDHTPGRKPSK